MAEEKEGNSIPTVPDNYARDGLTEAVRELNLSSVRNSKLNLTENRVNECVANWNFVNAMPNVIVSSTNLPELQTDVTKITSVTSTESASPMQPPKRKRGEEISDPCERIVDDKPKRILTIPRRLNKVSFILQNNSAAAKLNTEKLEDSSSSSNSSASEAEMLVERDEDDDLEAVDLEVASHVTVHTSDPTVEPGTSNSAMLPPVPQKIVPPASASLTEETQTLDPDEEYQVIPKAEQIWLLMKKHRSYQQRARLRGLLIRNLLENGMTPLWAIRRDHEPRPQYIQYSPSMIEMTKRHARELAQLASSELLSLSREEKDRADEYQEITEAIYVRESDLDFSKANKRCASIIAKNREQEKSKLDSSRTRDMDSFPSDDAAYRTLLEEQPRPSTSRRQASRSESRDTKRVRQTAQASGSAPPPPPPPPAAQPVTKQGNKGKAGPNSRVKGASNRGTLPGPSNQGQAQVNTPRAPATNSSRPSREPSPPSRGRSENRGQRGGRGGRGSFRGRGRGRSNERRPQQNTSDEDFINKLKGILKKFE